MAHYLSDIVSRSAGEGLHDILPANPGFSYPDVGINDDFQLEGQSQDTAGKESLTGHIAVTIKPLEAKEPDQMDSLTSHNSRVSENIKERTYFSRFIDRVVTIKEKSPETDLPRQPMHPVKGELSPDIKPGMVPAKAEIMEETDIQEPGSKNLASKKGPEKQNGEASEIKPKKVFQENDKFVVKKERQQMPNENTGKDNIKRLPEFLPFRQIFPNQPVIEERSPSEKQIQKEAPILIIGKISVEIVPPSVPVQTKTITKIIHASSGSTCSKTNKLSFGLGQL